MNLLLGVVIQFAGTSDWRYAFYLRVRTGHTAYVHIFRIFYNAIPDKEDGDFLHLKYVVVITDSVYLSKFINKANLCRGRREKFAST